MMHHLLLIRHSQTNPVPTISSHEWKLTKEGVQRCRQFAPIVQRFQPNRLISSQEPKAIATSQLLANQLGISHHTTDGLGETARATAPWFDDPAQFRQAIEQLFLHPNQRVFGEESGEEAFARFDKRIATLLTRYPNETLAIVTHGTILSLFVAHYNQIDVVAFWKSLGMPALIQLTLPHFTLQETINFKAK